MALGKVIGYEGIMANPVLNEETFAKTLSHRSGAVMTVQGAVGKSMLLGALCVLAALVGWKIPQAILVTPVVLILGLIIAIVLSFKPAWSAVLAPVYAILEGVFLGAVSAIFEANYEGIVLQVIGATGGVFFGMLGAYQLRLIRPTQRFRAIVFAATMGLLVFYLINMAVAFFTGSGFSIVSGNSGFAILFSIGACVLAALNLIIDFGVIEEGAQSGAPKYMEWYAAFGLLVTMVWLYLELLRLLSKLRSR